MKQKEKIRIYNKTYREKNKDKLEADREKKREYARIQREK